LWSSVDGAEPTFNISATGNTIKYEGWVPGSSVVFYILAKTIYGVASGFSPAKAITPANPTSVIPKAPTGLTTVSNVSSYAANGAAIATVNVSWTAVTQDTDNNPTTILDYEVWIDEAPYVRTSTNSVQFTLPANTTHTVRVRARSFVNAWGDLSTPPGLSITAASPTAVTRIPTPPVLTTNLGTVTVKWDGAYRRTNVVTNPGFEIDVTGWSTNGTITRARSTTRYYTGTASLLISPIATASDFFTSFTATGLTAGATYTASFWVYLTGAGTTYSNRGILVTGSTGGTTSSANYDTTKLNQWQRVSATATVGTGGTFQVRAYGMTTYDVYVDAVLMEQGSTLGTYFDGATTDTTDFDYSWGNGANASVSYAKTLTSTALGYGAGPVRVQQLISSVWTTVGGALEVNGSATIQSTTGATENFRLVAYDNLLQATGTSPQASITVTGVESTDVTASLLQWVEDNSGANVIVSATEPTGAQAGFLWFKTTVSGKIENIYIHNGTAFVLYTLIADSIIAANSITAKTLNASEIFADAAVLNSLKVGAASVGILTTSTIQGSGNLTLIAQDIIDAQTTADDATGLANDAASVAGSAASVADAANTLANTANTNINETRSRFVVWLTKL